MEDASYFSQSSWASFCPGALFVESTDQLSFIIRLVVVVVEDFLPMTLSSESGCVKFDDYLGEEGKPVLKKLFFDILYVLFLS